MDFASNFVKMSNVPNIEINEVQDKSGVGFTKPNSSVPLFS